MEEKIYFMPGDLVTLKQDIPNKPVMLVLRKETSTFRSDKYLNTKEDYLRGMRCRWFCDNGLMQEAIWNTKDLIKL